MPRTITRRLSDRNPVASPTDRQSPGYAPAARLVGGGGGRGRGAMEVANELQRLLGDGAKLATHFAGEKAQEMFNRGEADARMGKVDAETRSRWEAYNNAATQVEAEALIVKDEAEIAALVKPLVDAGDMNGVDQALQQEFAKRWGGVNGSEMEHIVTPWMGALHSKLAAQTIESARVIDEQNNLSNLQTFATGEAKRAAEADGVFDYAGFHARSVDLFGRAPSASVEAKILENVIREGVNPHVYLSMPDRHEDGTPTIKNHPIYGVQLRAAYEQANASLLEADAAEMTRKQAAFFDDFNAHNRNARIYDEENLVEALDMGWITPQQYAAMKDENLRTVQTAIEKAGDKLDLWDHFKNRTAFTVKGKYSDEDVGDQFDSYIEGTAPQSEDPNDFIKYVTRESMGNGLVYRPLQEKFTAVNIEDPKRFAETVDQFDLVYAISPKVARNYVKTEKDWELLQVASTLKKYGIDPVQRLTAIGTVDLEDRRQRFMEGDLRKEAQTYLRDAELGRPGRFFDKDLADLPANSRGVYARELGRLMDTLGSTGYFENSEALVEAASKMLEGRYMIAGDRLMPRPKSAPEDADRAMTWFATEGLAAPLAVTGFKPGDVELIADARSEYDGTYRLVIKGGIEPVLPDQRFRLDEIVTGYRENGVLENAEPYRTSWQAVLDRKDVTTPGAPALAYSSVTMPKVDKYVAERRYLTPEQRQKLDAQYLPTAQAEMAKAADKLNYWQTKKVGWGNVERYQKKNETRHAQAKFDYWSKAVEGLTAPPTPPSAPKPSPGATPESAESVPQAASQAAPKAVKDLTARDWQLHPKAREYAPIIAATEQSYGLPEGLLGRIAFQESRFNPKAYNKKVGASGIVQIVPKWHPGVDPWNPKVAIPYAASYLTKLHKQFGSWDKAVAAYNMGPGTVKSEKGLMYVLRTYGDNWLSHVPKETRDYVRNTAPLDV